MDDGHAAGSVGAPATETPLSEAQSGLWFAQRLDPANPIFNTAHYIDIRGDLDIEAFRAAVDQTAVEAEALSLRFVERGGAVVQTLDPAHRPFLRIVDVSGGVDPAAEAMAAMRRDHETPLDPTRDPLAANILFRMGARRFLWSLRVHHLATDGFGMALLTNRVAELYNAAARRPGARPGLQPHRQGLGRGRRLSRLGQAHGRRRLLARHHGRRARGRLSGARQGHDRPSLPPHRARPAAPGHGPSARPRRCRAPVVARRADRHRRRLCSPLLGRGRGRDRRAVDGPHGQRLGAHARHDHERPAAAPDAG